MSEALHMSKACREHVQIINTPEEEEGEEEEEKEKVRGRGRRRRQLPQSQE